MKIILAILAVLFLGGCAYDAYRNCLRQCTTSDIECMEACSLVFRECKNV